MAFFTSLPTDTCDAVGLGDGTDPGEGTAVLAVPIEWMRFCDVCESEQRFVADQECEFGLVGRCANCGEERFVRFTRTPTGDFYH